MKKWFKPISLLLALLMLVLPLVSCGTAEEATPDETRPAEEQKEAESADESVTAQVKEKYAGINLDGYDFRILSIDPGTHYYFMLDGETGVCNEVWYEEDNAEVQQHSVFTRNTLTSELLNIKISAIWGGGTYDIPEMVKTLVKAGGDDFDMHLGSQCKSLPLASEGYFYNLYDISSFDMDEDWWDKEYIDTFTYKFSNLYTVCGDYNIFDDYATPVVFYNQQVVTNYNLTDPADLVEAGTWTIENMMQMVDSVTSDTSGNGKLEIDDTWGLTDNEQFMFHFMQGCNVKLTETDEEGVPQVAIEKENFVNAVQYVFDKLATTPNAIYCGNGDCYDVFEDDRALFYHEILAGINMLRDMESNFSLLPLPKQNETQTNYTSLAQGIYLTVLSVPLSTKNPETVGTILNVLGGMSTDTVDAALHEVVLGPKLFREKRTNDMLTYALNARKYDWAENIAWAYPLMNLIIEQGSSEVFTISSSIQKNIKLIKAQLKRFVYQLAPSN